MFHWLLEVRSCICSYPVAHACFNKGNDVEINPANTDWLTKKKDIIQGRLKNNKTT